MPASDDAALVSRIRAGEPAAWRDLLTRHQDRLYTICVRMLGHREDARECCQDALVKIVQNFARFDGRSQFGTWAVRITMNTCLSALRARKLRRHRGLGPGADDEAAGLGSPGSGNSRRELTAGRGVQEDEERSVLRAAFSALEDEQRAVLLLRDVQGLDYDQIGEALDLPVGTVKSRIFRARAALREQVEARSGKAASAGAADGTGREGFGGPRA